KLDQPVGLLALTDTGIAISGLPSGLGLADLATLDPEDFGGQALDVSVTYDAPQAAHPYATHACMVEVDRGSGEVKFLKYVIAEDCGVVINPAIVDGQVMGGVAQGVGAALYEEIAYNADGQLLSGSFMDYLLPTSGEAPA